MCVEQNDALGKMEHAAISADISLKLFFSPSALLSSTLLLDSLPSCLVGDS